MGEKGKCFTFFSKTAMILQQKNCSLEPSIYSITKQMLLNENHVRKD